MAEYGEPSELFGYLKKFVKIQLKGNFVPAPDECLTHDRALYGWIYTIDPVSLIHVLVQFDELNSVPKNVYMIVKDEMEKIEIINNDTTSNEATLAHVENELETLFSKHCESNEEPDARSDLNMETRRDRLIEWLKKSHLPVKLETYTAEDNKSLTLNRINILDSVYIRPPYTANDCQSNNEIILNKIKQLVNTFYKT